MKKFLLSSILLLGTILLTGQQIDNITVEQTGDFIKIGYKIADSKPGQIYRVKVLCSINGGLNTELRSVSGDTGDNVQGGKAEYFVIWDVLKDVDELKSAEFIVRAELVPPVIQAGPTGKIPELTAKWSKKWINIGPAMEIPGPKPGAIIGVMGSFGVAGIVTTGKYSASEELAVQVGQTIDLDTYLEDKKVFSTTLLLTKRLVNYNGFQMHLMLGAQKTKLVFQALDQLATPYHEEKMIGPAAGLSFGVYRVSFNIIASHLDYGQVEKEANHDNWIPVTYRPYVTLSMGFRF